MTTKKDMKLILLQILLVLFGIFLGIICHGMLEKSCNDSGGSYLGGNCIFNSR